MTVLFRYKTGLSSSEFNLRFGDMLGGSILSGFYFKPGTNGLKLTITFGSDLTSLLVMSNGVRIEETKELVDVLTLSENTYDTTRIDSIYIHYIHGTTDAEVSYEIFEGDENGNAVSHLDKERYILLGKILLPPGVTTLDDSYFEYPERGLIIEEVASETTFKKKITLGNSAATPTPIESTDVVNKEYVDQLHITYDHVESTDYDVDKMVFLTSVFKREGIVMATSTISDFDDEGRFQLITCTYYEEDGVTVDHLEEWRVTYDTEGNIVTKTKLPS